MAARRRANSTSAAPPSTRAAPVPVVVPLLKVAQRPVGHRQDDGDPAWTAAVRNAKAMDDDHWSCCYVLYEGMTPPHIATLLGGRLTGRTLPERDATSVAAHWPSVGRVNSNWALVIDPHFEFGDTDDDLRRHSINGRVVRLEVIKNEGYSYATEWRDGEVVWKISYEAEIDSEPPSFGRLPYDLDKVRVDDFSELPILAAQEVTGWHPDAGRTAKRRGQFFELEYPRPDGVAAAVARDSRGP